MLRAQSNFRFTPLIWVLVSVIFVADVALPVEYDVVHAYLLALFFAVFFKEKSDVLLLSVITTVLTIIGATTGQNEALLSQILLDRLPTILSLWAAAFFVFRYLDLRKEESQQAGRFEALFRHATNGIILADKKGAIITANPAVEKLFGYDPGEMDGMMVENLIPDRLSRAHVEHRTDFYRDPRPRNMGLGLNLSGKKKDGAEFPVEVSLSPFQSHGQDFVVAFIVDNTLRKEYESSILKQKQELAGLTEALQELNEGLENKVAERTRELESAKNEVSAALEKERELGELKSRFVSMASHEFRTPLTSVLSSAGLIQQYADREDVANIKKHAERIKNAVTGLSTILTEFLSLGRLEEGRVAVNRIDSSVPECVEEVTESLKNLFKPGQTCEYTHSGSDIAHIDPNLTKNILINLLSNAIKYSPENAPILISSRCENGRVRIGVTDRGMGIPESEHKHLFERFFRASNSTNSTQGNGLGLYIVRCYAELMGGNAGFNSRLGEGSEFWVEFEAH